MRKLVWALLKYQDYTIRAQVSEGMNLAAAAKAAVAETFLNTGAAPASRVEAGMSTNATDTNGKYVTSVNVADGVITIVYGNDANAEIDGDSLQLTAWVTPDGSVTWQCGAANDPGNASAMGTAGSGGSLAQGELVRYLPAACRPQS